MPLLKVQKLKRSELNEVTNLHYRVLDESFLNNFGLNFLKISYQTIVKDKNNIVILAKKKKQVIGLFSYFSFGPLSARPNHLNLNRIYSSSGWISLALR